ncbi:MAG: SGNH/GDSL hydrolase family protein [Nocardioidaceae bacterium]|nr:SGNH/GDSL hydrolase family protein [Nocardioidaceae bacterium]MCL2612267.1 SGNH/GDSL hydrolase family protein [Nocardioidaceae bacterium]
MTSRLRTVRSTAATLLALPLLTAAGVAVTAPSASAKPPAPVVYDALGDSYASGYGVGGSGPCGQSPSAYGRQVDGRMHIALDDFVACAGATTASLVSGGQLNALDPSTDLVTLTIGGNDIGWSTAVTACLGGTDQQCAGAISAILGRIRSQLPSLLDGLYSQVRADAPNAEVLVTGYPRLFSPEYGAYLGASPAEQQSLNDGADVLNGVIANAAAAHGFDFVDVTKRFVGHGVNSPEPWVTSPFDAQALHPNADGWAAYTAAVTAAYVPGQMG